VNTFDNTPVEFFTQEEGGSWLKWPNDKPPPAHFFDKIRHRRGSKYKYFEVPDLGMVRVHSVRLVNGAEWDCQNGWRKRVVH